VPQVRVTGLLLLSDPAACYGAGPECGVFCDLYCMASRAREPASLPSQRRRDADRNPRSEPMVIGFLEGSWACLLDSLSRPASTRRQSLSALTAFVSRALALLCFTLRSIWSSGLIRSTATGVVLTDELQRQHDGGEVPEVWAACQCVSERTDTSGPTVPMRAPRWLEPLFKPPSSRRHMSRIVTASSFVAYSTFPVRLLFSYFSLAISSSTLSK